ESVALLEFTVLDCGLHHAQRREAKFGALLHGRHHVAVNAVRQAHTGSISGIIGAGPAKRSPDAASSGPRTGTAGIAPALPRASNRRHPRVQEAISRSATVLGSLSGKR